MDWTCHLEWAFSKQIHTKPSQGKKNPSLSQHCPLSLSLLLSTMLSRFITSTRPSHLRLLTLISSTNHFSNPKPLPPLPSSLSPITNPDSNFSFFIPRFFSSNRNNNGGNDQPTSKPDLWKVSSDNDQAEESVFGEEESGTLDGFSGNDAKTTEEESWLRSSADSKDDIFKGIEKEVQEGGKDGDDWATGDGYKAWSLVEEGKVDDVFDIGEEDVSEMSVGSGGGGHERVEIGKGEEDRKLEQEEKVLSAVLKGKLQLVSSSFQYEL